MNVHIIVGPSGSGKTTLARKLSDEDPNAVVVSRDNLREMLYAYEGQTVGAYYKHGRLRQREEVVTSFSNAIIYHAIQHGHSIIFDNTNLKLSYIRAFLSHFNGMKKAPTLYIHLLSTDLLECVTRQRHRERKVAGYIINGQRKAYEKLVESEDFAKFVAEKRIIIKTH